MKIKLLALATCLLTTSCATNKIPQFQNAIAEKNPHQIQDIVFENATEYNSKEFKGKLEETDSIAVFENKSPSSYDLYKFRQATGSYKITVKSYCDCFGFSKFMAVPNLLLIDNQKNPLPMQILEDKTELPMFGRLYYQKSWNIKIDDQKEAYLIVTSANEGLGKPTTSLDGIVSLGSDTFYINGIAVRAAPYGEYSLTLEPEKSYK